MPLDPKPYKPVGKLLEAIHNGEFVVPYFQRWFEWEPNMVKELLVSIISDYFAGLILLWELDPEKAKNEEWDPIWGAKIGENVYYVWCSINPQPSLHSDNSILKTNSYRVTTCWNPFQQTEPNASS